MRRKLTDNQIHTLLFIYDYINSNDYAPTSKDIGQALGFSSTTAHLRICYLLGHDCLRKTDTGQYGRNLELTEKGISLCESLSKK